MAQDASMYEDMPESESPAEDKSEGGEEQTALLPKDFFGDKELSVGNECKVKIEKVFDDEVQVSYVPHGESDSQESSDTTEASMPSKDDMMGDMG